MWSIFGYTPPPTKEEEEQKLREEIKLLLKDKTILGTSDFEAIWGMSDELCRELLTELYLCEPFKWQAMFHGFVFWMMKNHFQEFGFFLIAKKYIPNLDNYKNIEERDYFLKHTWDILHGLLGSSDEREEKFLITFMANQIFHDYRAFTHLNYHHLSRMLTCSLFSEHNSLNKKKQLTRKLVDILRTPGYINGIKDLHFFRKEILSPIRHHLLLVENELKLEKN